MTALQSRTVALERPPPRTAVLYPILLPDRLELLLNTADDIQQVTVRVDRDAFTDTVHEFRRTLEKRTSREYLPLAQRLHRLADRPAARRTRRPADRNAGHRTGWAVAYRAAGGSARRSGLSDQPLRDRHHARPDPDRSASDPAPENSALTQRSDRSGAGFPPLSYVHGELDAIHAAYGGTVLENEDFDLAAVQRELRETPIPSFTSPRTASLPAMCAILFIDL